MMKAQSKGERLEDIIEMEAEFQAVLDTSTEWEFQRLVQQ
jgi:hypothetical protein